MFRENLTLAKGIFEETAADKALFKKVPHSAEVQALVKRLVASTLAAYGEVGMIEPEALAQIDFLNQPGLLVELVGRGRRTAAPDMQLMADVTMEWMRYMIDRKFPPLTPHHTQALVVLMMSGFFRDHLDPNRGGDAPGACSARTPVSSKGKAPLALKAFIAQMATGEGKSIVIAMTAVFMVKLYGMKARPRSLNSAPWTWYPALLRPASIVLSCLALATKLRASRP